MRTLVAACTCVWMVAAVGTSQSPPSDTLRGLPHTPLALVSADDVARALGLDLVTTPTTITLRGAAGEWTGVARSSDGTWMPAGGEATAVAWSSAVVVDGGAWWIPVDATEVWGARLSGGVRWITPDGRSWRIEFPLTADVAGTRGTVVQPFRGVATGELDLFGDGSVIAWIADPATLTLLRPELTSVVDAAWSTARERPSLVWIVTATRDVTSLALPRVSLGREDGASIASQSSIEAGNGVTVEDLVGGRHAVGPESPWVAVVWLPPGSSISDLWRIDWGDANVELRFRP